LEDAIAAGALAALLEAGGAITTHDATRAARTLYLQERQILSTALRQCENGKRLVDVGLAEDIDWCARESVLDEVVIRHGDAMHLARNLPAR
jgi:phosphosulfolactate phosphohydrolase-like enzyme